jgi:hypothetical protein
MGLDVSVYQNVRLTNSDECDFIAFVIDKSWNHKIKNLQNNGKYTGDECDCSVRYAYSSHNRFREMLIKLIGREDLLDGGGRIIWEKHDQEKDTPFHDFINFADNEGCIDWETNQRIYKDFAEWDEKAIEFLNPIEHGYFYEKYAEWRVVFKYGSQVDSVVVFS